MITKTVKYTHSLGWSAALPRELDSEQTLVLAFAGAGYERESAPLRELVRAFPNSSVLGSSTAGEIHGSRVFDETIAAAVVKFEHTRVRATCSEITPGSGSFAAGARIATALAAADLRAVFVLSDGLQVNGSELARGIDVGVSRSVVVTGGLAADGDRFQRTWVLGGGGIRGGWVCAVGLYGDRVLVGHGSKGGWDIFGPERRITRAEANVLYEIDGRPALALYKEYLGARAAALPASALLFPLALRPPGGGDEQVVRTVLATHELNQSLTFAGDIPMGWHAQLMRSNLDRLVEGAAVAARRARSGVAHAAATLSIAISCVGRRLVLGDRIDEEIEATVESLPLVTVRAAIS